MNTVAKIFNKYQQTKFTSEGSHTTVKQDVSLGGQDSLTYTNQYITLIKWKTEIRWSSQQMHKKAFDKPQPLWFKKSKHIKKLNKVGTEKTYLNIFYMFDKHK